MRVTYVGPEAATVAFGYTLPRGIAVDVPDEDKHACMKLSNNHHFTTDAVAVEAPKRRGRPPKVAVEATPVEVDPDGENA